ncbi:uncharacterized protein LOC106729329 isoform X1 [Camelus ferus]|uniref:Uncharacterized protein LOC106729329 isoform X1 n=1 Tax=Camelus ferus TaxID=419612 RepID=A0A8B8RM60_CAMFR|nr:uncharacterized protein LOC106729329 isoform X1 [Camelus ferus]XP_032318410.1 uncharacterized protein LOC106729329 isoform X1 [Camelus ferus]
MNFGPQRTLVRNNSSLLFLWTHKVCWVAEIQLILVGLSWAWLQIPSPLWACFLDLCLGLAPPGAGTSRGYGTRDRLEPVMPINSDASWLQADHIMSGAGEQRGRSHGGAEEPGSEPASFNSTSMGLAAAVSDFPANEFLNTHPDVLGPGMKGLHPALINAVSTRPQRSVWADEVQGCPMMLSQHSGSLGGLARWPRTSPVSACRCAGGPARASRSGLEHRRPGMQDAELSSCGLPFHLGCDRPSDFSLSEIRTKVIGQVWREGRRRGNHSDNAKGPPESRLVIQTFAQRQKKGAHRTWSPLTRAYMDRKEQVLVECPFQGTVGICSTK